MPQQAFGLGGPPSNVSSWNAAGGVFSNQPATPVGRAMYNGDTRILPTGIVMHLAGRGAARSGTIYVGGASLVVGIPAAGNASQAVGGPTTARNLVGGGGAGVQVGSFIDGNGACYFGWSPLGGRVVHERDGTTNAGELAGYYDWAQAPSVPTSVSVTPNSGTQVTLNWGSPVDHGGAALNDFYIEYSTNPGFTSGVQVASTGGVGYSKVIGGLTPGQTYYFRVAALNEVTNLAGTAGPISAPVSVSLATVPGTPTSLTATPASSSSVNLAWAAPGNGGSAIIDSTVEYGTDPAFGAPTAVTGIGGTSASISGLTPGQTYYFRVRSRNSIGFGGNSSPASAFFGAVPGAPTNLGVVPGNGLVLVAWAAPSSDGGVAISSYSIEYSTSSVFASPSYASAPGGDRSKTIVGLIPGATYYFRVFAVNSIGASAPTASSSTVVFARDTLDTVRAASVSVDGAQVSIRSDGGNDPVLTLGYTAFGTGTAFVAISTNFGGAFYLPGGPRNLALVADPAGNLYLIGVDRTNTNYLLVYHFTRTGPAAWTYTGARNQALPALPDPIVQVAAAYTAGNGTANQIPTIVVLTRRAGAVGAGSLAYATLNLPVFTGGAGALFLSSGVDPAWLPTPPAGQSPNTGVIDIAHVPGTSVLAMVANGFAVIQANGGDVGWYSKAGNGTVMSGAWAKIIPTSANGFVLAWNNAGMIYFTFYNLLGTVLGQASIAAAAVQGGAAGIQWDAYYDRVAGVVTCYYIADNAGARQLESVDVSPTTYAALPPVVLTAALGAASSTNTTVRVPRGVVDERRVVVEAANLLSGVKSTALYVDTTGNLPPTAPLIGDFDGYDASAARVFPWTFGDPNPLDAQTAYEVQIQRVSDSVDVVATGKVSGTAASRTVAAATLTNGVGYRWRARTWDALDTAGAWSAYDAFTTAALGTLTITAPAADNPAGLETSSIGLVWTYAQADGYTQTQRRVRLIRVADSAVLSDTTMQASTATAFTVTNIPTDVPVRIELSIVTNAPGTPTVTANRLLTTSYGAPMTPTLTATLAASYIALTVTNPAPTGSRPEVATNAIERRRTGSTDAFAVIARVPRNGTYNDHAVASGAQYDYRVRGITA